MFGCFHYEFVSNTTTVVDWGGPCEDRRLDRRLLTTCPVVSTWLRKLFVGHNPIVQWAPKYFGLSHPASLFCRIVVSSDMLTPCSSSQTPIQPTAAESPVMEEFCNELVNSRTARTSWRGVVSGQMYIRNTRRGSQIFPLSDHLIIL